MSFLEQFSAENHPKVLSERATSGRNGTADVHDMTPCWE